MHLYHDFGKSVQISGRAAHANMVAEVVNMADFKKLKLEEGAASRVLILVIQVV